MYKTDLYQISADARIIYQRPGGKGASNTENVSAYIHTSNPTLCLLGAHHLSLCVVYYWDCIQVPVQALTEEAIRKG